MLVVFGVLHDVRRADAALRAGCRRSARAGSERGLRAAARVLAGRYPRRHDRPSPHPGALAGGRAAARRAARRRRRRGLRRRRSGAGSTPPTPPATASCPRSSSSRRPRTTSRPWRRSPPSTGLPVVARGAASSVAGQAIGPASSSTASSSTASSRSTPAGRRARVQPGVVQAALNAAAAAYGLEFGPDTSTVDQATIGGMVGNNSSGSRSIVYGESKDKVLRDRRRCSPAARAATSGRCPAAATSAAPASTVRRRGEARGRARAACASGTASPSPRAIPQHAALHVRLQPARAARARARTWPAARRLGGHARAVHRARGAARPAPGAAGGRGVHVRHPARRAGGQPRHPRDRAVGGRVPRPRAAAPGAQPRHLQAHGAAARRRRRGHAHRRVPGRARTRRSPGSRACARSPASSAPRRWPGSSSPTTSPRRRPCAAPSCRCSWARRAPSARRRSSRTRRWRRSAWPTSSTTSSARRGSRHPRHLHRPRLGRAACTCGRMLDLKTAAGVARMDALAGRGRPARRRLPRRHLGRARLRPLAQLVPAAAARPGPLRGDGGGQGRVRPARGCSTPGVVVDGPGVDRVAALRRRLPRRRTAGRRGSRTPPRAASIWPSRSASAPACARSSRARCARPAPRPRDEARTTRARANALQGVRVRRRAAGGDRRGRVPRRARHLRRLQGLQDRVPGRRRHGRAQGGVARRGARAGGRAGARARHRRLPPPGRPRRAGRAARQRGSAAPARRGS